MRSSVLILFLFLAPFPAFAQGQASPGMHSLEFTEEAAVPPALGNPPSAAAPSPLPDLGMTPKTLTLIPDETEPVPTPQDPPTGTPAPGPTTPVAEPDPSLKNLPPMSKTKTWDLRAKIYAGLNDAAARKSLIASFNQNPGRAGPNDLILMAQLFQLDGDMTRAATLYYTAQLRHAFDARRLPRRPSPPLNMTPEAEMIGAWAAASSDRLRTVIAAVEKFDGETPYGYRPAAAATQAPGDLPEPSVDEWPEILENTRADFFLKMNEITTALARMGR